MDNKEILLQEKDALRRELKHLKDCQLRYFILSITVTGLVLSIGAKGNGISSSVYLGPLVIVLPCWIIFFDKAKTITRIVGYYRVLEQMANGNKSFQHIGWENSLCKFRDWQSANKLTYNLETDDDRKETIKQILKLNVPHRYWVINYYTFATLSLLSVVCSLADFSLKNILFATVSLIFIAVSMRYNLNMLYDLIDGRNSYDANQNFWEKILKQ